MSKKAYKAKRNEVIDESGNVIAVITPVGCSKKDAAIMAAFAAQQMNYEVARKASEKAWW